jgi:hypothetical protein
MKTTMKKQGAYIGAGAGLVLFGLFGLLPGSLLGGAAGINIRIFFGLPLMGLWVIVPSMLVGVLASAR